MVATVEPVPIGAMPEKQVRRKVIVSAMPIFVNDIFPICHQENMLTGPLLMLSYCASTCLECLQLLADLLVGD